MLAGCGIAQHRARAREVGRIHDKLGELGRKLRRQHFLHVRRMARIDADRLPAALTLTSATIQGQSLVAAFDIDGGVLMDAALQANGSCG